MTDLFDIQKVMFSVWEYPVSYIEFVGTIAGIIAVWLAAKSNILTWPIGLINIILFFIIFFQVQLYSDMFLQVYYFLISIYGWLFWDKDYKERHPIRELSNTQRIRLLILVSLTTLLFGYIISHLHQWVGGVFQKPAAFPYADTFVAICSIVANTLLARRVIDNWPIWILVNIICIYLYFMKSIVFVSFEYFIFLILAIYGYWEWNRKGERDKGKGIRDKG